MPKVRLRVLNNEPSSIPKKALEPPPAKAMPKKRASKKSAARALEDVEIDYALLNRSELLALARIAEIPGASAAAPRDMLTRSLMRLEPIPLRNPMEPFREKLTKWIRRHWDKLRMQIPEDYETRLKSDSQTAYFYLKNKDQIT